MKTVAEHFSDSNRNLVLAFMADARERVKHGLYPLTPLEFACLLPSYPGMLHVNEEADNITADLKKTNWHKFEIRGPQTFDRKHVTFYEVDLSLPFYTAMLTALRT